MQALLQNYNERECGPMPNVMAALAIIGGAVYKSSLILSLVSRHKVWLPPTARVSCSNAANIGKRKTYDSKWILHLTEFR